MINTNNLKLINHLTEIKYRLSYICISFLITSVSLYFYIGEIIYFIVKPLIKNSNNTIQSLIYTDISEAFIASLKLILFVSFLFTIPLFFYQFYYFILPGMYQYERKNVLRLLLGSNIFLILSLILSYNYIIPFIWHFFLNCDFNLNKEIFDILYQGKIIEYINFVISIFFSLLIICQSPVIVTFLLYSKLLNKSILQKYRHINIILCFILGALLSPPDVFSQILLAIPLCLTYEFSIFLSIFLGNKENYLEKIKL